METSKLSHQAHRLKSTIRRPRQTDLPIKCQRRQPPNNSVNRFMALTMLVIQLMMMFSLMIKLAKTEQIAESQYKSSLISAEIDNKLADSSGSRILTVNSPTFGLLGANVGADYNKLKTTVDNDLLPSARLAEFVDSNYLSPKESPATLATSTQKHEEGSMGTTSTMTLGQSQHTMSNKNIIQEEISTLSTNTKIASAGTTTTSTTPTSKTRRQTTDNKTKLMADWWNELLKKNNKKLAGNKTAQGFESTGSKKSSKPSIYKEQPLSQNSILTSRNQLIAIRDKHRLLMSKAVPQLQQLDQRLVDSYKLCLRRKMPLYGGMLYRTRDFVVKMANEVKHERQVLEAMAKQIQKVLRERIANKTLIKEYNRVVQTAESEPELKLQQLMSVPVDEMDSKKQLDNLKVISVSVANDELSNATGEQQQQATSDKSTSAKDQPLKRATNSAHTNRNTHEQQQRSDDDDDDCPGKQNSKTNKQLKYTVHINEVNLKKELAKTQALVNRINSSCHDLNGVIDDILYLFKLTSEPKRNAGKTQNKYGNSYFSSSWMSSSSSSSSDAMMTPMEQQRRLKKMLKSPLRIYLERYGKLTAGNFENMYIPPNIIDDKMMKLVNGTSAGESISNNLDASTGVELKPLFDAPTLSSSIELSDLDLGFDGSAPVAVKSVI